ncbi:MAG TPA: AAA family ATPase [Marinospirillum sp.]|uniref:AAA family ATPase n=1 Tax=Marinospirillum sp. TaxID=2183934 RepID=UPI002B46F182|nr:AAA family ATPase [Marinospirillum sp.]HKM16551.1 AAA family ATPase [Marinospirillum sp.]
MQPREPLLNSETSFNEQLLLLEHVNDGAVFYAGKQHGKHLDLLLHLSRYSNLLLTVTGQQGSGKTHLKNRMLQQLDSGVVVSLLDAKTATSAAQLLPKLSQSLNIEIPAKADFEFYLTEIRHLSNQLSEEGGSCLIVIDNAENLEQDALDLILELATTISDSQRPHLALFGRQALFTKLHHKDNLARFESVGHHLPLEGFNESEARSYLEHRCASVGINSLPLNEQQFANVYKASKGLPGLLNLALVNQLRQGENNPVTPNDEKPAKKIKSPAKPTTAKAKPNKTTKKANEQRKLPLWLLFAGAGVLALLVVGFLYKDQFLSNSTPNESLANDSKDPLHSKNTLPTLPIKPLVETDPLIIEEAFTPETVIVDEQPTIPATEILLDLPDDTPNSIKPSIAPTPATPKVIAKPAAWVDAGSRREATLMAKPANHYSLQMMGTQDEAAVKSYIQAQAAPANFSYFEGRYKDKPWYVVVYGDYTDRDQALAAIQSLPEALQKQRPWAKSFQSVQTDIRSR